MEAYGRSYGGCLNEPSPSLGEAGDNHGVTDFAVDFWRLCALDGLREILMELRYFSEAECAAEAELAWNDIFEEASGFKQDKDFARGLSKFAGYVRGRQVESAIQEAIEEARRHVVVSDPDAFATKVAESVAARLGPVPVVTRSGIEDDLKSHLGPAWTHPPDAVREQIVEAEWLRGLLEVCEGRDYSPVVVFYGKALESLLRYLSQSDDILSEFRQRLIDPRLRVHWLPSKAPQYVKDRLVASIDLRNAAAHGEPGPYRPTPRSRMVRMRDLVLGSESEDSLLKLLHGHAKWP